MNIKINNNEFMEAFHDFILGFDKLDEQTKQVYYAIIDLTSDITNLWEKEWLSSAIIAHLYTGVFKETYRKEFIGRTVDRYFGLLKDRYINAITLEHD